jgi:glycosyltransferase involved in cell wall biosynthesis
MKIILGIQGFMPYKNGGGGAKVADIMFKALNFKSLNGNKIYFAWENGLIEIKETNHDADIPHNKSSLRQLIALIFKKAISFKSIYYLFSVYKEKQFTKRVIDFQLACGPGEEIVVHSFVNTGLYSYFQNRDWNRYNNVRTIISYHSKGSYAEDLGFKKSSSFYRYITKREDFEIAKAYMITFPSRAAMKMFIDKKNPALFEGKKLEIVYNGIDCGKIDAIRRKLEIASTESKTKVRIINVANHVPQKRFDALIKVVKLLRNGNSDFEVINIGYGEFLAKHEEIIKKEGLQEHITILGKLPNERVIEEMLCSDIFFMPSEKVVFDLVTLEAMYCSLAVVVSRDGGNLEAIEDGRDGFLVDKDDLQEFAATLLNLIKNSRLRKEVGEKAREKISSRFTMEKMTEGYVKLYNECI